MTDTYTGAVSVGGDKIPDLGLELSAG